MKGFIEATVVSPIEVFIPGTVLYMYNESDQITLIKVSKMGRSNLDPGRGCQYCRYSCDHPLNQLVNDDDLVPGGNTTPSLCTGQFFFRTFFSSSVA